MKTKVLFLINTLRDGGAEKILVDIVNNLDPHKYDIEIKLIYKRGQFIERLHDNIKLTWIADYEDRVKSKMVSRILPRFSPKILHKLFVQDQYDVEIAFLEGYATKIISGGSLSTKKIAWVHCDVTHPDCWINEIGCSDEVFKSTYRKFNTVVCVAESVKRAFISRFGDVTEIVVKYNPVDTEVIRYKSNLPADIHFSKEKFKMVTIGRLTAPKKMMRLFAAVKNLKRAGYQMELFIIGEGEERKALETFIENNQLEDTIKMLGFKSNPYPYIKEADCYVCSSIYEGFSTAATEAVVLGKPVLTTDVSGMREILDDGKCGLITENDDAAFEQGLKRLLDNPKLIDEYTAKANDRSKFFEFSERLKSIETLFENSGEK